MPNLLYIGNKLERHGYSPTSTDILPKLFNKEGFNTIACSSKKNKILRIIDITWHILKYAPSSKYVLIDTYSTLNFWFAIWSGILCIILKVNYIPVLRGGNLSYRLKNNKTITKFFFNNSYINIAPSQFFKVQFKTNDITNVKYIPNSISLDNYLFTQRRKLRPKIFWLRAFAEVYNPTMAILVLEKLLEIYPEAELCMVGPDKDGSLSNLKQYVRKQGLPVIFTGKLNKKDWIILSNEYDIFINTSNIDNTPVSVIEAMALGLPVISTNVGGIPYLITHEENGLLIKPGEVEEMIMEIKKLLKNPELAERLSTKGRQGAEKFNWTQVKPLWLELLG